jgi:hypothetical protein
MSTATIATTASRMAPIVPKINQPAIKTIPDDNPSIPQFADIGMVDSFGFQRHPFRPEYINACL